ncbi:precorrin-3B synthase [Caballeronia terrestris]|uniref:precorrin-3B synthase n=1 Tax=Caballeronia terrestris TaxID=1226301 RepID=UPI002E101152
MPARDGGLCRIRLMGGELSAAAAHAVADAAARHASGVIEVTNRANLQLRGVRDDGIVALLLDAGLGPATPSADDIRNVMLSPIASDETRALAAQIVDGMQRDTRLHALSPKFALLVDGGERLAMLDHPHDIWFASMDDGERFAFGLAGCPVDMPIGAVGRAQVVALAAALLHAFIDFAAPEQARMRDLLDTLPLDQLLGALDVPFTRDVRTWRHAAADPSLRLGAHFQAGDASMYVGAQPPLGRLTVSNLHALAHLAASKGSGILQMTPWQSVLLPGIAHDDAPAVLDTLQSLGLATDASDPLARLIACAGSPGCGRSQADTKADALQLAQRLPAHAGEVHLSGCTRSCAAAHRVENTLLAVAPGRYDLYQHAMQPDASHFGRCVAHNITIEEAADWLARSTTDA